MCFVCDIKNACNFSLKFCVKRYVQIVLIFVWDIMEIKYKFLVYILFLCQS